MSKKRRQGGRKPVPRPVVPAQRRDDLAERLAAFNPTEMDTARHEAGHAVAYFALGIPVLTVSIGLADEATRPGWRTLARIDSGDIPGGCSGWEGVVTLFAGPLAEGTMLGAGHDLPLIAEIHRPWVTDRTPASPHTAARLLVEETRPVIEAVAVALVERRTLTGQDLAEILQQVTGRTELALAPGVLQHRR